MRRIGIIGAGNIARVHVAGWQQLPVEIVGYYDAVPAAAQRFGQQYGGQAFDDLHQLLDQVDIVDICSPSVAHKEHVLAVARTGKPMVCEKPLARHLADCYEMVEAVERAGVPLFVAHVVRFFAQFAQAKAVIDSGAIGKPGVIRTVRAGAFPRGRAFFTDFSLSGGVILDVGIHDIDFHRWCMGEVERVFARGLTFRPTERDHALITLRFANGGVGHIEAGWAGPPGLWRTQFEISGDGGVIEWDSNDNGPITQIMANEADDGNIYSEQSPLAPTNNPYYAELAHFLDCLETGNPFLVSPDDALMAVKVALAANESMRTGKPVEIAKFAG
jgi:UDP-N-acetylglucosamine 3-dehydrogenase